MPVRPEGQARDGAHRAARIHPRGLARLSARTSGRASSTATACYGPYDPANGHRFNPQQAADRPLRQGAVRRAPLARRAFRLSRRRAARRPRPRPRATRLSSCRNAWWSTPPSPGATTAPPRRPWSDTIIYEAHVKGMTAAREDIPEHLRGTFAGSRRSARHRPSREARRHRRRADAGAGLLRRPLPRREEARRTTGATTPSTISRSPPRYISPRRRPARVQGDGAPPARGRHRGHPRRRLQPHRRGQPSRARRSPSAASTMPATTCSADDKRFYFDTTGCGNTVNLRHPRVLQMVMDSLRYWVEECHVDGFRFDLATSLGREYDQLRPQRRLLRRGAAGSGAVARQDDRRALGHRPERLPGRQFPARLGRVERPLPRRHAQLLEGRRRPAAGRLARPARLVRPVRAAGAEALGERQLRHRP